MAKYDAMFDPRENQRLRSQLMTLKHGRHHKALS